MIDYLKEYCPRARILALDITDRPPLSGGDGLTYKRLDLSDQEAILQALEAFRPDYIVHLASISSVSASWKNPKESFINNTNIFMNLLEDVHQLGLRSRILSVGSSEEYGNYPASEMPLTENHPLRPGSPYAVARVSQELLSRLYADGFGLDIVMTRSFNHIGPRQNVIFVIPSFIQQLLDIAENHKAHKMRVGNVDISRDFLDVRDVADAYYKILRHGQSGEIYNVCGGAGVKLRDVIALIAEKLNMEVELQIDPELIRPADNMVVIGDNSKLRRELNWEKRYELEATIDDMIRFKKGLPL
jgi:GDP-4-dehydro-6-deoxy-D-mannose reductase